MLSHIMLMDEGACWHWPPRMLLVSDEQHALEGNA